MNDVLDTAVAAHGGLDRWDHVFEPRRVVVQRRDGTLTDAAGIRRSRLTVTWLRIVRPARYFTFSSAVSSD